MFCPSSGAIMHPVEASKRTMGAVKAISLFIVRFPRWGCGGWRHSTLDDAGLKLGLPTKQRSGHLKNIFFS